MAKGIVRNLDNRISRIITGISRPVDELGRVVIPKEYRKVLGFADYQRCGGIVHERLLALSQV